MTVPLLVDIASLLDQLGITPASMRIEWPLTSPARASALAPGRPGTAGPDWRPTGPCRHCWPDTSHPTPKETP